MAAKTFVCVALLAFLAAASTASANSIGPGPCGYGCRACDTATGICSRCNTKIGAYVLNTATGKCDCAPGFGVCTNPAAVAGIQKSNFKAAKCPADGSQPAVMSCKKCRAGITSAGGQITTWPTTAVCGGPTAVPGLQLTITAPGVPPTLRTIRRMKRAAKKAQKKGATFEAAQVVNGTYKGCAPQVIDDIIKKDIIATLTAAGGPAPFTFEPTDLGCTNDGNPTTVGTTYNFKVFWTGADKAAELNAAINADPPGNPQAFCAVFSPICPEYTAATGGIISSGTSTVVLPTPPPPPGTSPIPPPNSPPAPAFFV